MCGRIGSMNNSKQPTNNNNIENDCQTLVTSAGRRRANSKEQWPGNRRTTYTLSLLHCCYRRSSRTIFNFRYLTSQTLDEIPSTNRFQLFSNHFGRNNGHYIREARTHTHTFGAGDKELIWFPMSHESMSSETPYYFIVVRSTAQRRETRDETVRTRTASIKTFSFFSPFSFLLFGVSRSFETHRRKLDGFRLQSFANKSNNTTNHTW